MRKSIRFLISRQPAADFAIRTTTAAAGGMICALLLGINHPWWAAMTVWLVAQPTRGLMLERMIARFAGSLVGALAGTAILLCLPMKSFEQLLALTLWLAICAGVGSFFRQFRNYGFVLAGYTAAIIVMFSYFESHTDVSLALDRTLCTLIGIVFAGLSAFYSLSGNRFAALCQRFDTLVETVLSQVHLNPRPPMRQLAGYVDDIVSLDASLDREAAGSLLAMRETDRMKQALLVLLDIIAAISRATPRDMIPSLHVGRSLFPELNSQALALSDIPLAVLRRSLSDPEEKMGFFSWLRHHDWSAVLRAVLRPVGALVLSGSLWLFTGWQAGPVMVMTAVLFASLFSSHPQGNAALADVLAGTVAGALAGGLFRLWIAPYLGHDIGLLTGILPFLIIGAYLMASPRTSKMAIDFNMTFLLVTQPFSSNLSPSTPDILTDCAAILSGAALATLWYCLALPSSRHVNQARATRRLIRIADQLENSTSPQEKMWMLRHGKTTLMQIFASHGHDERLITSGLRYLRYAQHSAAQLYSHNNNSSRKPGRRHCAMLAARLIQRHLTCNRRII